MKPIVKRVLMTIAVVLLAGGLTTAVVWANIEERNAVCRGVVITIDNTGPSSFLTPKGVANELHQAGIDPYGKLIDNINTLDIENLLNSFQYIESAECAFSSDHYLHLEVKQLVPVMRIFPTNGDSYYINAEGKRMNARVEHHIDVPIVNCDFLRPNYKPTDLVPLTQFINSSSDLACYVTMVDANDPHNIIIYPNIRGHVINIGDVSNLESKFRKIKMMYDQVIPHTGWWAYDTIVVKWNHQIVGIRRNKSLPKEIQYAPDDDEIAPDIETISADGSTAVSGPAADTEDTAAASKPLPQSAPKPAAKPATTPQPIHEEPAPENRPHKDAGQTVKNAFNNNQ